MVQSNRMRTEGRRAWSVLLLMPLLACGTTQPAKAPGAGPAEAAAECETIPYDRDECTADPRELCRSYRAELIPEVAAAGVRCLRAAECDLCRVNECTMSTLAEAPKAGAAEARCATVEERCPGMGELCAEGVAGMNAQGRERFTACLIESCGLGVRYCLWGPGVNPCHAGEAPVPGP